MMIKCFRQFIDLFIKCIYLVNFKVFDLEHLVLKY